MGKSEVPSLCHHLLAVLLILVIAVLINNKSSNAQQLYNGDTYVCSDSGATSCSAFALYRAQRGYTNLTSIASLFSSVNTTTLAGVLGDLNNLPTVNLRLTLTIGQPILVPLDCECFNHTSYANLTHIIAAGDTFYDLNVKTYEYLSTTNAVIDANPSLDYSDLIIGTPMIFPLRCACPSSAQIADGVTSLVTYPVVKGDSTEQVAAHFGVPEGSIVNANRIPGANPGITEQTTLLVPINTSTPTYTTVLSPPASAPIRSLAAPGPESASGRHGNSKAGVCVVIAIWFSLALSLSLSF